MNHYELMVILSPTLTEEAEKEQVLQVEDLLKREKSTIHFVDHWGKRKLAYPIKRQRQGFYEWFYFEAEPGHITELDRKLKMAESILRFMILRMEKAQIVNFQKDLARRREAASVQTEPVPAEPTTPLVAAVPGETPADEVVELIADENPDEAPEA